MPHCTIPQDLDEAGHMGQTQKESELTCLSQLTRKLGCSRGGGCSSACGGCSRGGGSSSACGGCSCGARGARGGR